MYHDEIPERCKLDFTGIADDALRIAGELFPKQTLKKYIRKEVEIETTDGRGCGSPVFKVSDLGRHVTSSSPVPLKTRRVGQRCTFNLSRAETSSRWCGVVVRRGGASSGVVHVTRPWFKITWSVA
ncbi:uncharacterized protein TNCV_2571341 [Trichonephila clavipes]|nr:uncharacterized protein TNCV_2571341 [Trichonephila clavipes]